MKAFLKFRNTIAVVGLILLAILLISSIPDIPEIIDEIKNEHRIDLKNFSLDTVTEEDIIKGERSSSFMSSTKNTSGSATGDSNASDNADVDKIVYSCKSITGICTMHSAKVTDSTLTFNISSTLSAGKAKMVIICDDQILEYIELGENKTFVFDEPGEHIYDVKLLGESAELEIQITRTIE